MSSSESPEIDFVRWENVLRDGTFEESLLALEEIGGLLEGGNLSLEQSLRGYELGVLMARRCEKMLSDAELRIERLDIENEELP